MRSNFLLRLPRLLAASATWLFLCFLELEGAPEVILASSCRWQALSFPQLQVAKWRLGPQPRLQHDTLSTQGQKLGSGRAKSLSLSLYPLAFIPYISNISITIHNSIEITVMK